MNNYPAPRINQALGIDPGASLDDALAAIAQLRAHVAGSETARLERNYLAQTARVLLELTDEATIEDIVLAIKGQCDGMSAWCDEAMRHRKTIEKVKAELEALQAQLQTERAASNAGAERDAEDIHRMRLENNRMAADLETARAAHRFAERMQRERDTAYAVLHHLTAEFAP